MATQILTQTDGTRFAYIQHTYNAIISQAVNLSVEIAREMNDSPDRYAMTYGEEAQIKKWIISNFTKLIGIFHKSMNFVDDITPFEATATSVVLRYVLPLYPLDVPLQGLSGDETREENIHTAYVDLIADNIENYLVNSVLYEWFKLKNADVANSYNIIAQQYKLEVNRNFNTRKRAVHASYNIM